MRGDKVIERFSTFVDPRRHIPQNITELTGITDEMVEGAPLEGEAVEAFLSFCNGAPVIAHNAKFDTGFIKIAAERNGLTFDNTIICTLILAQALLPELKKHKLNIIADHLNIDNPNHHRAVNDAEVTGAIWAEFLRKMKALGVSNVMDINSTLGGQIDVRKTKNCYHVIILIKEFKGIKNGRHHEES
jgi:DNA polymerase-3 subunit alpha (Gram-positive type)